LLEETIRVANTAVKVIDPRFLHSGAHRSDFHLHT
jgi:hypothetical protein